MFTNKRWKEDAIEAEGQLSRGLIRKTTDKFTPYNRCVNIYVIKKQTIYRLRVYRAQSTDDHCPYSVHKSFYYRLEEHHFDSRAQRGERKSYRKFCKQITISTLNKYVEKLSTSTPRCESRSLEKYFINSLKIISNIGRLN